MKHASQATLDLLADLLESIRKLPGVTERTPGCFYRKSSALLHFHEDGAGLFADLKRSGAWERMPVNTAGERAACLHATAQAANEQHT
ncbi:MAG TPA: hypothetical protein VHI13_22250 [Candidatus Kapabacteria bacterium]|nr:hypothetical protein [Candidatus Kapabacteria bacterium]